VDQPGDFVVDAGEVLPVDLENRESRGREPPDQSGLGARRPRSPASEFVGEFFEPRVMSHDEYASSILGGRDVGKECSRSGKIEFFRKLEFRRIRKTLAQALEGRSGSPSRRTEDSLGREAPVPQVPPHVDGRLAATRTQRTVEISRIISSVGGVRVPQER